MTDAEAIEILARWVYELRVDLVCAEARHTMRVADLEERIRELRATVNGYAYWVNSGLTPSELHDAARELDPAVA